MDAYLKNKGPRACATCARAKSRCVPGPAGERCERCSRLDKACSSQTPAPPRKRKEPKPTKVAELERRLVELTTRIESAHSAAAKPPQPQQVSPPQLPSPEEEQEDPQHPHPLPHTTVQCLPAAKALWPIKHNDPFHHIFPTDRSVAAPAPPRSVADSICGMPGDCVRPSESGPPRALLTPPDSSVSDPSQDMMDDQISVTHTTGAATLAEAQWPQPVEAAMLLNEYRVGMAHLWPFLVLPPRLTAQELRAQRPFVWKAIMVAATQLDGPRQMVLGNQLIRDISEAALLRPRKGIDLLQAIELVMCWFHYSLNSFQVTNLLYLARAMLSSLGMSESQGTARLKAGDSAGLEMMRTFAGVYYVVTLVFTTNKKPDALMNTSYLAACCRELEERKEYPSDELVVRLVQIQQLSQSISLTAAFRCLNMHEVEMPMNITIKNFQQQIEAFEASLPANTLLENAIMANHVHTCKMMLYEVGLQDSAATGLTPAERVELLWSCLRASNAFLAVRFETSITDRPRFSCLSAYELLYTFQVSLRLVTLTLPGWDLRAVRAQLSLDRLLENFVSDMDALARRRRQRATTVPGGDGGAPDPFAVIAQKLRALKVAIRYELESVYVVPAAAVEDAPASATGGEMGEDDVTGAPAVVGDDALAVVGPTGGSGFDNLTLDFFQDGDASWQDVFSSFNEWGGDDMMAVDGWSLP